MIAFTLLYTRDDLTREEIDSLWEQGVCMDDWDYILMFDDASLFQENKEPGFSCTYEPTDYTVDRLLTGCCSNCWYKANLKGKTRMIGVAYHA